MPDAQEPDAPAQQSLGDGPAADGTKQDSRPAKQQQYDPQRYQPQQQPQQLQEGAAANPSSSSYTRAAFEKARQTLEQLPAGPAAARRSQHAGAAPHRSLHMPLPRQPALQQLQVCVGFQCRV
jgi:hypothetical protein